MKMKIQPKYARMIGALSRVSSRLNSPISGLGLGFWLGLGLGDRRQGTCDIASAQLGLLLCTYTDTEGYFALLLLLPYWNLVYADYGRFPSLEP